MGWKKARGWGGGRWAAREHKLQQTGLYVTIVPWILNFVPAFKGFHFRAFFFMCLIEDFVPIRILLLS